MTKTTKRKYVSLVVEQIEAHVEKGFSGSNSAEPNGLTDYTIQESQTNKFS